MKKLNNLPTISLLCEVLIKAPHNPSTNNSYLSFQPQHFLSRVENVSMANSFLILPPHFLLLNLLLF